MIETGKIINGDCIEVMKTFPEGSIDLLVTSPPYNVNISYDVHKDDLPMDEYYDVTKDWFREALRVLKDDGRIAVNVPNELNVQERGQDYTIIQIFGQLDKSNCFQKMDL
jgi:site-specific DNA-methyltransferase (adenine-specific)